MATMPAWPGHAEVFPDKPHRSRTGTGSNVSRTIAGSSAIVSSGRYVGMNHFCAMRVGTTALPITAVTKMVYCC